MKNHKYCPFCRNELHPIPAHLPDAGVPSCTCGYKFWNNPVPAVAVLIPVNNGVVLVQRKVPPFIGEWCLPCGFMEPKEHPKIAACREVQEETNLIVKTERVLSVTNPKPGELNEVIIFYLARPVGGELRAGDDALRADIFKRDALPKICFSSHQMLLDKWFEGAKEFDL